MSLIFIIENRKNRTNSLYYSKSTLYLTRYYLNPKYYLYQYSLEGGLRNSSS